jgi:membrane associated rhomboid family serine protease
VSGKVLWLSFLAVLNAVMVVRNVVEGDAAWAALGGFAVGMCIAAVLGHFADGRRR